MAEDVLLHDMSVNCHSVVPVTNRANLEIVALFRNHFDW